MGPYLQRAALALLTSGWGSDAVRGGIDPAGHQVRLRFIGVVEVWKDSDSRVGPYPPRKGLALRTPGWGFHTVRGGYRSEGRPFCCPVC